MQRQWGLPVSYDASGLQGSSVLARWDDSANGHTRSLVPLGDDLAPLTQTPVVIFSTAGSPEVVENTLAGWVNSFAAWGHRDVSILVVEDGARAESAAIRRSADEWSAQGLGRFAVLGEAPPSRLKSRIRELVLMQVHKTVGPTVLEHCRALLAPGMVGSANVAFLMTELYPRLWIEQDAHPEIEVVDGSPIQVDVMRVVDSLLYDPQLTAAPVTRIGWDDVGPDSTTGPLRAVGRRSSAHFNVCGDLDYRAAYSHNKVTMGFARNIGWRSHLAGNLTYGWSPDNAMAPTMRAEATSFGTAVGFHRELDLIPFMFATRVRLIDFALTDMLCAAGQGVAVIAPFHLSHRRVSHTDSGRGELRAFMAREQWLWTIYYFLQEVLVAYPRRHEEPDLDWLERLAAGLRSCVADARWSCVPALRQHASCQFDRRLLSEYASDVPDEVRRYLSASCASRPTSWVEEYANGNAVVCSELHAMADQCLAWAAICEVWRDASSELADLVASCKLGLGLPN
jgi:hypothetical protein